LTETVIATVKAFSSGKPDSKIVTIPKQIRKILGDENTEFFIVLLDGRGRIIYEPIKRGK